MKLNYSFKVRDLFELVEKRLGGLEFNFSLFIGQAQPALTSIKKEEQAPVLTTTQPAAMTQPVGSLALQAPAPVLPAPLALALAPAPQTVPVQITITDEEVQITHSPLAPEQKTGKRKYKDYDANLSPEELEKAKAKRAIWNKASQAKRERAATATAAKQASAPKPELEVVAPSTAPFQYNGQVHIGSNGHNR